MYFPALILYFSGFTFSMVHCEDSNISVAFPEATFFHSGSTDVTDWLVAFENASILLKDYHPPIRRTVADCSPGSNDTEACRGLTIRQPQIKISLQGILKYTYLGEPDAIEIVKFVKTNIKPSFYSLTSLESIDEFLKNDEPAFIATFEKGSKLESVFINVADKNYNGPNIFGHSTRGANLEKLGKGIGIVHYPRNHVKKNIKPFIYTGEISEDAFNEFVSFPFEMTKGEKSKPDSSKKPKTKIEKSTKAIISVESLNELLKNDTGVFIGAFEKGSKLESIFLEFANKSHDDDAIFAHSSDSAVLEKLGQKNGIVYYAPNHSKLKIEPVVFTGEVSADAFGDFVAYHIQIIKRQRIPKGVVATPIGSCGGKVQILPIVTMITAHVLFLH